MPTFRYQILNAAGQPEQGEIDARDVRGATLQLEETGAQVLSVELAEPPKPPVSGEPATVPAPGKPVTLREQDFLELGEQIARLAAAGAPLASGLQALAEEVPSGRLRQALERISRQMERGDDLQRILTEQNAPRDLLAVLNAALRSGQLSLVLGQYVAHRKRIAALRGRLALGFGYPLALLGVVLFIYLMFSLYLVPQFEDIFVGFGVDLPALTWLLLGSSRFLRDYGVGLLAGGICLAAAGWLIYRRMVSPARRERFKFAIPVIGPILKSAAISRFLQLLALLVEKQTPLPIALELAGSGAGNAEVERSAAQLASAVQMSGGVEVALAEKTCFPPSLVRFLGSVTPQASFGEMIHALGATYENRSRMRAMLLAAISEPAIVLFAALMVGLLLISMFLPLIKLLTDLS